MNGLHWSNASSNCSEPSALLAWRQIGSLRGFAGLSGDRIITFHSVNNTLIQNRASNRSLPATRLFNLKMKESLVLNKPRRLWKTQVWVAGLHSAKEHVIVISSDRTQTMLDDDCKRWSIETLFQPLKKRGFNLKETGWRDMQRVERLFAVIALSFCWCHHTGCLLDQERTIKILKHGRPAKKVNSVMDGITCALWSSISVQGKQSIIWLPISIIGSWRSVRLQAISENCPLQSPGLCLFLF